MKKFLLFILPMLFCVFVSNAQFTSVDENAAMQLINASKSAIGLSAEDLNKVKITNTYVDQSSGIRMVYLIQTHQGIPVYNQMLVLAFKNGKLVSNQGALNRSVEKLANVKTGIPAVTAEAAVQSALSDRSMQATQMAFPVSTKDNGQKVEFTNMGVSRENITAQLMWVPVEQTVNKITSVTKVRLAWQVYLIPKTTPDYWMVRVDATDNSILGMTNLTDYDTWGHSNNNGSLRYPSFGSSQTLAPDNSLFDFKTITTPGQGLNGNGPSIVNSATYRVIPFPAESPWAAGGIGSYALRTDPWTAAPGNATTLKWHTGASSTNYDYSRGNNVWAYQDQANNNTGTIAKSAQSTTTPDPLTFNFAPDTTAPPTQTTPAPNQQFNITNLFYWNNVIHDVMYIYGFNEASSNFQDDNMGRGGVANDHVNAEAQDGGGTNNANFSTPADGGSGRMQMYLWTLGGSNPQKDGDADNGIVIHEFSHGTSNRLTGGGTAGCLGNAEQMGEGWSDYYALMFTQNWATATLNTGFNTPRGIGLYALNGSNLFGGSPAGTGIRHLPYCTNFAVNGQVYLANLPTTPHDRGEIWCATLWDMTWNIINQVGVINPNLYNLAGGGGNAIAMKLVTEGLKLQQCNPGFISGRNAILAADQALYGGLYNCAIWEAFRRRGMGAFASEGSTSSVTDQIVDFTPPITFGATVSALTIPEGQTLNYINSVATCSAVTGYTLRDTLPTNVTYLSGGTYDAPTRVVSFPVTQGAGTTNYPFSVVVNAGSYFPPNIVFEDVVVGPTIPATWSISSTTANNWVSSTARSHSAPNSYFSVNTAVISDQRLFSTNAITLGATPPDLTFWHWFETESTYDGGILEISTDGGTTYNQVLNSGITEGNYTGTMDASTVLAGRLAWTGSSGGWQRVRVPLTPYANQSIKIRFRSTTDLGTNAEGWYIDDIAIKNIAVVKMRSSLFNASNTRVSFKDMETEITPVVVCSPTITQQPVNVTTCTATNASFTCSATATGGVTYQWQESTTGAGGPWNNVTNGGVYSGATLSTLTLTGVTVAMNGYQYRCVVTGSCNPTATSVAAILNVAAASIGGTINPPNTPVCGTTNSGILTLSGHTGAVIRWESATVLAGPYTPVTPANTTTTLTFNNLTQTTYYRAVVQVPGCVAVNSSVATVTFSAAGSLVIIADPGSTLCQGDPALLTVRIGSSSPVGTLYNQAGVAGNGSPSQVFEPANAAFTSQSADDFTVPAGTSWTVTRVTADGIGTGVPTSVNVFFYNNSAGNLPGTVLASYPNLTTFVQTGANYNVTLPAGLPLAPGTYWVSVQVNMSFAIGGQWFWGNTGTTNIGNEYAWQNPGGGFGTPCAGWGYGSTGCAVGGGVNRNNIFSIVGTSLTDGGPLPPGYTFLWSPAAGLSSTTTNPVAASPMTTTTYTVNVNDGAGCIRQANILMTVNLRPTVTTQPANRTNCVGTTATFTVAATGTTLAYQWQLSTTGAGGPWTNLANAAPYSNVNTPTLTVGPVTLAMNGYQYRCVVTGVCAPVGSANISVGAVLSVNPLPTVVVTPTTGCGGVAGSFGTLLTASGANSYTWAPLAGLYTDALCTVAYTGTNTATVYAAPTTFTAYTVTGTLTATGCSNTATALLQYTPPAPTVTPSAVAMCLGDAAVKLKSSSSQAFSATFNSGAMSLAVPDGPLTWPQTVFPGVSTPNLAVSGIPAGATITGMSVKLNLTHTYIADMVIVLKGPNGQVLNLDANINKTGGAGANFVNTIISSASTTPLSNGTPPYTGTFQPDAVGATYVAAGFTFPGGPTSPAGYIPTVSSFSGLYSVPNGNWTMGIYDWGFGDLGTLTNWELKIDYTLGVPATPAVWSPIAGLFSDASASTAYVAGTAVDSVWAKPTPSGVYPYTATVQSLGGPASDITTTFANNNAFGLVIFNFKNNNTFPVNITGIESIASTSGASIATLYYKTTPITGPPGAISAANGWLPAGTGNYTAIANTTTTTPQVFLSGLSLTIPAGATYGLGVESKAAGVGNLRYSTVAAGVYTISANGCDLITGTNIGFAGDIAPATLLNTPRGFIGIVRFGSNASVCTSPARTVVVTVNSPTTVTAQPVNQAVCTDKVATFTVAAGGSGPLSYQWQVSTNNGNTYTNIANGGVYSGATTATLTITAPPVSMNGYFYRAVITGAAPCAASTSFQVTLTVNPLPTIVISASPYTSLFPGLSTTLSSVVTPNAATSYAWLRNGTPVAGAFNATLVVGADGLGDYTLRVTDSKGCTNTSNVVTLKDSVSGKCFIYPNPNKGQFQVRYYSTANSVLPRTLTVYDAKGSRVMTQYYTIGRPYDRMDVDLRKNGKGLYWVEIGDLNGNRLTMCRIVIE